MQTVGILGGVGPLAGAEFYRRLVERTPAQEDAQHVRVVLVSDPSIPSRVEHLLHAGQSPGPALARLAHLLQEMGASVIAVPSSTCHAYHGEIQRAVGVPVINLLAEVAAAVTAGGYRRAALLATTPTVTLDLYGPYLGAEVQTLYPDPTSQDEVQQIVADVKSGGDRNYLSKRLREVVSRQWALQADCVVLACTELCLLDRVDRRRRTVSATDVLVDAVLRSVGRR